MSPERFAVELTPLPTASRVARQRGRLRYQIIVAVILAVVLLIAWLAPQLLPAGPRGVIQEVLPSWMVPTLAVLWGLSSAFWIGLTMYWLAQAKRDLASIGQGVALFIDSTGLEFVQPVSVKASWAEISALKVTGTGFGAGPKLSMEVGGKPVAAIPISFLDAMPAAIDSAVGARSLGRIRLDVSDMDKMF